MDALVERHEAFRTRFEMIDGELFQIVEDQVPSVVELLELETAGLEQVMEWIKPFDLTSAPLVRVKLIRLSQEEHILFIDMHHIISDQSSIAILMQDFARMYRGETLQSLDIQYKDYAEWRDEAASHGRLLKTPSFGYGNSRTCLHRLNCLQTSQDMARHPTAETDVPLNLVSR